MFWNLSRFNKGMPLLAGLVAGAAARAAEQDSQEELVQHMLQVGCFFGREDLCVQACAGA
jgi:hypothetical protein